MSDTRVVFVSGTRRIEVTHENVGQAMEILTRLVDTLFPEVRHSGNTVTVRIHDAKGGS